LFRLAPAGARRERSGRGEGRRRGRRARGRARSRLARGRFPRRRSARVRGGRPSAAASSGPGLRARGGGRGLMHFGATLRLLRVDAGISLRGLAERIGVSSAYLSRVENGHDAPPTPDRLVALAKELGVAPASLVGLTDRPSPTVSEYVARVPAASALFFEIARRDLTTAQ